MLCVRRFEHAGKERWCLLTVELGGDGRYKLLSSTGKATEARGSTRIIAESRGLKSAMENFERACQRATSTGYQMTDEEPLAAELAASLQAGATDWVDDAPAPVMPPPAPVRLAGGGVLTPIIF